MQYSKSRTTKYMSFKGSKDYDVSPKVGFESLASPGQVITVSTAQDFNTSRKAYSSNVLQTNTGINKQVGTGYTMTTSSSAVHEHYKMASPISNITNQHVSVNMGTTFAHRSALNHHSLVGGAATISNIPDVPANTAFVGSTDLRNAYRPSGPAQLTIFYAGSVCVYDDISPDKVQAIMLLAGKRNSPKNPPNKIFPSPTPTAPIVIQVETQTRTPLWSANNKKKFKNNSSNDHTTLHLSEIPSPTPISVCVPWHVSCGATNGFLGNEHRKNAQSSSTNFASPISVCFRSSGGSADVTSARSLTSLASPSRKPEPSQVSVPQSSRVSNPTTTTPSAVPQARKASLARFLEKRKERAVTVAPYPCPEKQSLECVTLRSETRSFSITSSGSFSSMDQK